VTAVSAVNSIALRPYRYDDLDDLVVAANHPEITPYLRDHFPYPYLREHGEWWLTEGMRQLGSHSAITLNDRCIGGISVVFGVAEAHLSGEIGYWLGRPYWGRGYATEAVRQKTAEVFATTDLVRIAAHVFAPNTASMRILEKCGYELEGILRRSIIKNGNIMDSHVYAKLRDE